MNIEICKNCGAEFVMFQGRRTTFISCYGMKTKSLCFRKYLLHNEFNEVFNKSVIIKKDRDDKVQASCYYLKPKKKMKCLKNEKVNENCPYSFEHEISDLIKSS